MKKFYFTFFYLIILLLTNGCSEDDEPQIKLNDISVNSTVDNIIWEDLDDLNNQLLTAFEFSSGNASTNEIETSVVTNNNYTLATATINYKQNYQYELYF